MELLDAKFKVNGPQCRLELIFRNVILEADGKSKMQSVSMGFMKGMPLEDYVTGLRALADHIDNEVKPSLTIFEKAVKLVTG